MNMISTGAFLNEMDASNKQETISEKFVRAWEKKNAKAARAGGVSLMALSLAACGGSSSTTSTSSTTTTTTTTPTAQTYVLTTNVDDITGGAGDDTVKATLGTGGNWSVVDVIDGGAGDGDTLAVVDTASGGTDFSAYLLNVSNVEKLTVRGADDINVVSKGTAFTSVTTSQSVDATVDANAASAVDVSGATGNIVIDGGSSVSVGDVTAAKNITVGGTTAAKGAITVTDTNVTTGLISVNGGTDVTVTASKVSIAGSANLDTTGNSTADTKAAVIVGNSTHDGASTVTGTATVTTSGAAITTASSDATLGAISAGAKGNVTITQSATSDASAAAADTASVATITQGAIYVSTGADGTTVSVTQDANQTANDAVAAVAAKAATQTITFTKADATDTVTVTFDTNDLIKFTAAKALTATEVASAFANLSKDATTGNAAAALGEYSNGSGTIAEGWTSGDVVTSADGLSATVTFYNDATNTLSVAAGGGDTVTATAATATAATSAVLAETGKLGVVAGVVHIDGLITGTDVLKDVTIDAFETGSTLKTDALETLTLKNSDEDLTVTTAGTGTVTVNVDKVAGATATLSLDGTAATVTGLNVNATGTKSDIAITADAATTVAVNAAVDLDLTASSFDKATKITVEGAGKVTLDGDHSTSVLAEVDASAATGTVDASGVALTAAGVYKGGSGADTFTVTASATKASTGGAGNDVITVSSFGTGGSVDAGAGDDTLVMTVANAATADANTTFSTKATNFEVLKLSGSNLAATTLDMANLGLTSSVTTAGTGQVAFSDATAYTATDKVIIEVNGTSVTTVVGAVTGTLATDNATVTTALNSAIGTALGAAGTYVAGVYGTANKSLTITAANDTITLQGVDFTNTGGTSLASTIADSALTLDKLASGATVTLTKVGDVIAQVKDAATGTADVLNVAMESDGALDAGEFTAANVETINISSVDTFTDVTGAKDEFGANIADGKDDTNATHTLNLTAGAATTVNLTGSSDITLDLISSSAVATFNASTYTGKIALTLDGAATGTTFTGGSGVDTIAASGDNDVINGGDGADVITVATLTTVTGGAGADVIKLTGAVAATKYSTITDASAGDVIDTTATSFTSTAVSLAATASFQDYLDAAVAAQTTNGNVAANWFQHGGNTFLVIDGDESNTNSATYVGTNDGVIALTGLIDLSAAAFNATTGEFTIA